MVRIKSPTSVEKRKRISVRVPIGMAKQMEHDLLLSGYNKKQWFNWYEDILNELFAKKEYPNLVAEEFITAGTTKVITLAISNELYKKIEVAVNVVFEQENAIADKSSVIRTAIIQRLLKSSGQLLED